MYRINAAIFFVTSLVSISLQTVYETQIEGCKNVEAYCSIDSTYISHFSFEENFCSDCIGHCLYFTFEILSIWLQYPILVFSVFSLQFWFYVLNFCFSKFSLQFWFYVLNFCFMVLKPRSC